MIQWTFEFKSLEEIFYFGPVAFLVINKTQIGFHIGFFLWEFSIVRRVGD